MPFTLFYEFDESESPGWPRETVLRVGQLSGSLNLMKIDIQYYFHDNLLTLAIY